MAKNSPPHTFCLPIKSEDWPNEALFETIQCLNRNNNISFCSVENNCSFAKFRQKHKNFSKITGRTVIIWWSNLLDPETIFSWRCALFQHSNMATFKFVFITPDSLTRNWTEFFETELIDWLAEENRTPEKTAFKLGHLLTVTPEPTKKGIKENTSYDPAFLIHLSPGRDG